MRYKKYSESFAEKQLVVAKKKISHYQLLLVNRVKQTVTFSSFNGSELLVVY